MKQIDRPMMDRTIQILNAIIRKSDNFGFDVQKYCINVKNKLVKELEDSKGEKTK